MLHRCWQKQVWVWQSQPQAVHPPPLQLEARIRPRNLRGPGPREAGLGAHTAAGGGEGRSSRFLLLTPIPPLPGVLGLPADGLPHPGLPPQKVPLGFSLWLSTSWRAGVPTPGTPATLDMETTQLWGEAVTSVQAPLVGGGAG